MLSGMLTLVQPAAQGSDSAPAPGCGATPPAAGVAVFEHQGVRRTYRLELPARFDNARPARLILAFHGWGGDETEFTGEAPVVQESARRGYVVVAPRGLGSGGPDQRNNSWTFRGSAEGVIEDGGATAPVCDPAATPDYTYPSCAKGRARSSCSWTQCQDDDVDFVRALVEHLRRTLCIDDAHVFAVGGSNGGMFTWELGADPRTAPIFRAIVPIIGLPHRGDLRPPARTGGLPVLLITGQSDHTVPPGAWDDASFTTSSDGTDRYYYTGATAVVRRWSEAAGCPVDAGERPLPAGPAGVDCRSYCPASPGTLPRVLECRAPMGHDYQFAWSWPLALDFFDGF